MKHTDWRNYPGELVTDRANAAYRDGNYPDLEKVVREVEDSLRWRIYELARRVEYLERQVGSKRG